MALPGILQQIARSNPIMSQIKSMMGMLNGTQNPQAMLNQMMVNNPQMKQVMDFVNQSGGDPKKALYALAEQRGINPQDILDMLK